MMHQVRFRISEPQAVFLSKISCYLNCQDSSGSESEPTRTGAEKLEMENGSVTAVSLVIPSSPISINNLPPSGLDLDQWSSPEDQFPLYPQKRTSELNGAMSALCQKQTLEPNPIRSAIYRCTEPQALALTRQVDKHRRLCLPQKGHAK